MDLCTLVDLATRAGKYPGDYVTALETHTLILEQSIRESELVHTFRFKSTGKTQWRSGQHGIFTLRTPEAAPDSKRVFSIASSRTEDHIQFSTIITKNPSLYKSQLVRLSPGAEIHMRGPIGEFHLRNTTRKLVGVAGGIGITPLRAILKEVYDTQRNDIEIVVLYGCVPGTCAFTKELEEWTTMPNVTVEYPNGRDELQSRLTEVARSFGNTAHYYISGAPNMIEQLRLLLRQQQIRHIISDPFKGYM